MSYADRIKQQILNIENHGNNYPSEKYRMSMISLGCDRRIQLIRNRDLVSEDYHASFDEKIRALNTGINPAVFGMLIHEYIQEHIPFSRSEEEVQVGDDIEFIGHFDGVTKIDDEDVLVEIKTLSKYALKYLPKTLHIEQMHAYMAALGISHGVLLYVFRENGEVHPYDIEFDINVWSKVQDRFRSIKQAEEQMILLPGVKPNRGGFPCAYCPFEDFCHPYYCRECEIHQQCLSGDGCGCPRDNACGVMSK